MNLLKKYAWYGFAAVGAATAAIVLLFAGPGGTAQALALSNNLETTISVSTNVATGSNTFTTLPAITLTCGVVDVTAGAANGVSGITLTLGSGWTFLGGAAPAITYAAWPAPDGQATGTLASASTITDAITTSCSPGSVVTFTGVQVKPLTSGSASTTIFADINTADVTVARLTAVAAPTPTPTATATAAPTATATAAPTATATAAPTATATAAPTATATAAPTAAPTVAPTAAPTAVPTAAPSGPLAGAPTATPTPVPTGGAPTPAPTGNAGLANGPDAGLPPWAVGLLLFAVAGLAVTARRLVAARTER